MKGMVTLGWQFHCVLDEGECDDPDRMYGDSWQNPDQEAHVLAAARAHANRTGHAAIIERHQRVLINPRSNKDEPSGRRHTLTKEQAEERFGNRAGAFYDTYKAVAGPMLKALGEAESDTDTKIHSCGEGVPCGHFDPCPIKDGA